MTRFAGKGRSFSLIPVAAWGGTDIGITCSARSLEALRSLPRSL